MMNTFLLPTIVILTALAVVVTAWSLHGDLKAYRAWKAERNEPKPRWKRRQEGPEHEERERRRWSWLILALKCAGFGVVVGAIGATIGFYTRTAWLLITGANLVILGVMAWVFYSIILPKPDALRRKPLPAWLTRQKPQ